MWKPVISCLFVLAGIALALLIIFDNRVNSVVRWKRTTKGTVNYDAMMRSFVYRVNLTPGELFEKLRVPNIHDEMKYELSEDRKTITFRQEEWETEPCELQIEPDGDGCLICIRRTKPFAFNNVRDLPYLMDRFWVNKLQARPVDYSEWTHARETEQE